MSRRRFLSSAALLLATLWVGARVEAQTPADEAQIKAAFVYNFFKFVDWPETAFRGPQDAFVVAIVGDGATADAADRFLTAKLLGDRPLVVRRMGWDQSFDGVHALFVTERDERRLRRILYAAALASVLSIGDSDDFATHGGVIGLVVDNRKVRFDIDVDAAQAAHLHVSSKLLALTRTVHSTATLSGVRP